MPKRITHPRTSEISRRIQVAREKMGLTCRQLDKLAGITPGHTSAIERRPDPGHMSINTACLLCDALDMTLDEFVYGSDS